MGERCSNGMDLELHVSDKIDTDPRNDIQYPSLSSITVISIPSLVFNPLNSGPGYTLCLARPCDKSSKFTTTEMPPYAHPTTRTRWGFARPRLEKSWSRMMRNTKTGVERSTKVFQKGVGAFRALEII